MPDANGYLTPEELNNVQQRLAEYWAQGAILCPVSRDSLWNINGLILAPVAANVYGLVPAGNYFPVVTVVCQTCGYTMFFSAVKLGVLPPFGTPVPYPPLSPPPPPPPSPAPPPPFPPGGLSLG